jgi:hypothetical protein
VVPKGVLSSSIQEPLAIVEKETTMDIQASKARSHSGGIAHGDMSSVKPTLT